MYSIVCIMPTYNRPNLIQEAIYSVLSQTYKNWELFILHDGPIVREYKTFSDNRIHFSCYKERTASPAILRNILLDKALFTNADYICFLDDDDAFHPEYMEKMADTLQESPEFDAVYCGRSYYTDTFYRGNYMNSVFYPLNVINEILASKKTGYLAMPDVLIRSKVFKDGNVRFHGKTWQFGCEDIDLYTKMHFAGYKFTNLQEYLVKVRWHNSIEPNHSVLRGKKHFEKLGDLRV